MASAEISARDVSRKLVVVVKIRRSREMAVRHAIAIALIKLACWIGWMGIEVSDQIGE